MGQAGLLTVELFATLLEAILAIRAKRAADDLLVEPSEVLLHRSKRLCACHVTAGGQRAIYR